MPDNELRYRVTRAVHQAMSLCKSTEEITDVALAEIGEPVSYDELTRVLIERFGDQPQAVDSHSLMLGVAWFVLNRYDICRKPRGGGQDGDEQTALR